MGELGSCDLAKPRGAFSHCNQAQRPPVTEPHARQRTTVAHITAPAAFGGLERVVSGLTRAMAEDHDVILILVLEPSIALPTWTAEIADAGVTVVPVRVAPRGYLAERRALLQTLRAHRVDVVHTHGYRPDVIAGALARRAGYPTVSTVHGFTRHGLRNRAYEWLQVRGLTRYSAVVGVSRALVDELRERGVPVNRLSLIPNGIVSSTATLLDRAEARRRLALPQDACVIGWVGRFSYEKGPDVMVRAFAMMQDHAARLCLVGDGPLLDETRALVASLGVSERVHFVGAVPDASIVYHAFDAFALSSRTEGTPMVLLEAAMASVPIVATAVGGVPDVLQGADESLVPSGNIARLAGALDSVLANPSSAASTAARLHERTSSPDDGAGWVDRYRTLYRAVLDRAALSRFGAGAPSLHQNNSVR